MAKVGHFYRMEMAGKIERTKENRLVWISGDEFENISREIVDGLPKEN